LINVTLEQVLRSLGVLLAVPEVPLSGRVRPVFDDGFLTGFTVAWVTPTGEHKRVGVRGAEITEMI
jgi:hypothetical protein